MDEREKDLSKLLGEVARTYLDACKRPFKGAKVGAVVKVDIVNSLTSSLALDEGRYKIYGSIGQGGFARVPWIAIFDTRATKTAQEGLYLVYLFSTDMKRLYLSLNQGYARFTDIHGMSKKALEEVGEAAKIYRENCWVQGENYIQDIDLNSGSANNIEGYMRGHIIGKAYSTDALPSSGVLVDDVKDMVGIYENLVNLDERMKRLSNIQAGVDETYVSIKSAEGREKYRLHLLRERKIGLVKEAKKLFKKDHGGRLYCEVPGCGFDFYEKYGERGRDFIEAHHGGVPVAKMKEGHQTDVKDFIMVCSNCHRMIHRWHPWLTKDELKNLIKT